MTNRLSGISILFGICFLLSGCIPDQANQIEPKDLFTEFRKAGISTQPLNSDHFPKLRQSVPGYTPLGIYKSGTVSGHYLIYLSIITLVLPWNTHSIGIYILFLVNQLQRKSWEY